MTQKTDRSKKAVSAHRKVQSSTTRSRKTVKRPASRSSKAEKTATAKSTQSPKNAKMTKNEAATKLAEDEVMTSVEEQSETTVTIEATEKSAATEETGETKDDTAAKVSGQTAKTAPAEAVTGVSAKASEQPADGTDDNSEPTETMLEEAVKAATEPEARKAKMPSSEKTEAEIEAEEPVVIVPKIQKFSDRGPSNKVTRPTVRATLGGSLDINLPIGKAKKANATQGSANMNAGANMAQAQSATPARGANVAHTQSANTTTTAATQAGSPVKVEFKANVIMPQADMSHVHAQMRARRAQTIDNANAAPRVTGKEMKEKAIQGALAKAAREPKVQVKAFGRVRIGWQRVALALSCAVAIVLAVVYFVNINTPNISLKVAAMQSGIEASYPSYTPRDFSLTDITSENGKITLNFKNAEGNVAYSITEERSSWDSNALLTNYVKTNFETDYSAVKEQGLTLYISSNNSEVVWVNGGVLYKIKVKSGSLTKKQITTIATSL